MAVQWGIREGELKVQETKEDTGVITEGLCPKAGLRVEEDHCFMWDWEENMGGDIWFIGEEVGNFEFLLGSFYFLWSKRKGHVLKKRREGVGQGVRETAAVSCSSEYGHLLCVSQVEGMQDGVVARQEVRELWVFTWCGWNGKHEESTMEMKGCDTRRTLGKGRD